MKTNTEEWLRFNLGSTGGLTGTDWKALHAAVAIVELYAYDGSADVLPAFRAVVMRMQETTREYAYHAIAMVLDWHNRPQIWAQAGLPAIAKPMRCKAEPAIVAESNNDERLANLLRGPRVGKDGRILGGTYDGMTPDEVIRQRDSYRRIVGE